MRALKENVLPMVMKEYLYMKPRAFNRILEGTHSAIRQSAAGKCSTRRDQVPQGAEDHVQTTPARRREDRDLRNMATMAAANSLYGDVPVQLTGNVEAHDLRGGHQADTAVTAHREGTCGEEASTSPHESWAWINPVPYLRRATRSSSPHMRTMHLKAHSCTLT